MIKKEWMQKRMICVLLMFAALLLLSSCGISGKEALQETVSDTAGASTMETSQEETVDPEISESEQIQSDSTEIRMSFGDIVVFATMDNSETTKAFLELLPLTLSMNRYGDREYYAAISELPENGEAIPDFENGDVTYYTSGKSFAIFFGNEGNSSQSDLIRMGKITSDLSIFNTMEENVLVTVEIADGQKGEFMQEYDFSVWC